MSGKKKKECFTGAQAVDPCGGMTHHKEGAKYDHSINCPKNVASKFQRINGPNEDLGRYCGEKTGPDIPTADEGISVWNGELISGAILILGKRSSGQLGYAFLLESF